MLQVFGCYFELSCTSLLVADKCLDLTEVLSELLVKPVAYQVARIQLVTRQRVLARQHSSHLPPTTSPFVVVA